MAKSTFLKTFLGLETKAASEPPETPDPQIPWATAFSRANLPWGGSYSLDKGLKEGYEVGEVVRACVDTYANHVSSVPWRVSRFSDEEAKRWYEWERKGVPPSDLADFTRNWKMTRGLSRTEKKVHELEPQPHHPLENLIERPNEFMMRKTLIEFMTIHLLLAGNAIAIKTVRQLGERNGRAGPFGSPLELWPIQEISKIKPIADEKEFIKHYEYKPQNHKDPVTFDKSDVVHIYLPNPRNLRWGLPLLQSGLRTLKLDGEAAEWQRNMFENVGVPPMAISLEREVTRGKYEEIMQLLREQFMGPANARKALVLGNAAKFSNLGLSAVELDFIKSREISARRLCTLFRIDPRLIGLAEEQGDLATVHRNHWVNAIIPLLERFQNVFDLYLTPEFPGEKLLPWFDLANVDALREDYHKKVQSGKILWSEGVPFDLINARLNLGFPPHIEGGEWGYFPASAVRADQLDAQARAAIAAMKRIEEGHQEGLFDAPGSGNTNTPPDGGDPGGTPNSDQPQDNQPQDDQPDNQGKRLALPEVSHATKRWVDAEAHALLDEHEVKNYLLIEDDGNFFVYQLGDIDPLILDVLQSVTQDLEGVEIIVTDEGLTAVKFYHGERDDKVATLKRERMANWEQLGIASYGSKDPAPERNGHR